MERILSHGQARGRRHPARRGEPPSGWRAARSARVLRHAHRRRQRRLPARAPPRAARPAGLLRLAQPRRLARREHARHVRAARVREASPDRLLLDRSAAGRMLAAPVAPRTQGRQRVRDRLAAPSCASALTLGIADRPGRRVEYRTFPEVGNFEADFFDPTGGSPTIRTPRLSACGPRTQLLGRAPRRALFAGGDPCHGDDRTTGQRAQAEAFLADVLLARRATRSSTGTSGR